MDNKIVGFLGAGNMAKALAKAFIDSGVLKSSNVIASAPSDRNLQAFKEWGVKTTHNNSDLSECDVVFLCVKPHLMEIALASMREAKFPLFVSVASGLTLLQLEQMCLPLLVKYKETHGVIGAPTCRVIRVMPNTCCLVRSGVAMFALGEKATPEDVAFVQNLLRQVGVSEEVKEPQLDAVCGLAGSGTAFTYTFLEALADGGVKAGLSRSLSIELAAKMVLGCAKMSLETGKHTAQLKDEVCSPGGTTIYGMHELEKGAFRSSVISAVTTAANRCKELGQKK